MFMGDNMDKRINDFVLFCIEYYKTESKLSGQEVYEIFKEYGVFEYLEEGYEMLHTQGKEWLIKDIKEFLKNRGYKEI